MTDTATAPTTDLHDLRLPELWERYAEVVGEHTRCPNKRFLIRKITEAQPADEPEPEKLTKLDVRQLRARYHEVIGRPTSSHSKAYLVWKLRQAERGHVRIGPVERSTGAAQKVIPLRLETELVDRLDRVRRKRGMNSRMELFRRALNCYLTELGEDQLACRFEVLADSK